MTVYRVAPCLLVIVAAGCPDGPKEKTVYAVRGRLTHGGKPMFQAMITFHSVDPTNRATPAHGTADADGRYVLHTYRPDDGAPAGECVVTIYWPAPRPKATPNAPTADAEDGGALPTIDKLKGQYSTVGASKLRAKVEPTDNEIDFNIP